MTSKQIDHYSKQIVDKLYSAYGTDSGIIFGIKDRKIVEGIVEFTLIQIEREIEPPPKIFSNFDDEIDIF